MRDKHQITEEPCEVKVSCTVLKTNGVGDNLVEFNQSGDGLVEKASGSSLCRISLWQYVLTGVETGRLPENSITKELIDYRDSLKANVSAQGEKFLGGKHI